ncbi:phosphonate ABC transporter, permease protein PhnE [Jiangella asiatica]|uniref:Phosphonate ABC transporter, permease protein PhnE n=1 Tax=Jiangella asiatica TaxID=2530372 RepID=A0A4R5DV16_9ACTN|nr:phosphonate ABC transporter, permease protein PhnE [Jiangella asiatica]TDE16001.1 phosphonate ABC transporter, permease protein PhnE [Jiangella asiatica]
MNALAPPRVSGPGGTGRPRPRSRPPLSWRRRVLVTLGGVGLFATVASWWYLEFSPAVLLDGTDAVARLVGRMLPPVVDDPGRTVDLVVETLLMALLGTVIATVLSVPLAFLAARNTTPHPVVQAAARGVITFCRAVPDLVFAIVLVRAMGIGVLAGVLALALHSVGMLGKLFADAIEEIDEGPREAVRSTGAGRLAVLVSGVVPQVVPSWIGTFVYRVDINLRISVVLGFVGAGGIGFALQSSLRSLSYDAALGMVLAILAVLAAMEVASVGVRHLLLQPSARHPRRDRAARWIFGAGLLLATGFAFAWLRIDPLTMVTSAPDVVAAAMRLVPPDFGLVGGQLWEAVLQTLAIGVLATAGGIVMSIPLGLLAARTVSPHPVLAWAARGLMLAVRSVPELILAVVFVAAVGLGPVAGVCALGIGSIGFLGKLVADAAEEIDLGPVEAVRAVGGGWWQVLFSAVLPQVMPSLIGSSLYLLDVNIRHSTVLGIVGAGGVGFLLYEAVRTLNFEFAGAIILIVFVIVYVIERLSGWIRAQV